MRHVTLVIGAILLGLQLTGSPAEARPKLIYHNVNTDRYQVSANASYIDTLPFNGLVVNSYQADRIMKPFTTIGYSGIFNSLNPVSTALQNVNDNYAMVFVRRPNDFFDSWTQCIENFRTLARAARDAGYAGISFDNEEYYEATWLYPSTVKYKSYTLDAYRQQARLRGRQIMQAMKAEWPAVRIMHLHGPYQSESRTPEYVTMSQTWHRNDDLSGSFFVGMLQDAYVGQPARVIDGGEVYQYRTPTDFQRSYDWRKTQQAALTPNALIPSTLASEWSVRSSIAFGVYDLEWISGYSMSPSIMRTTLENALRRADELVWYYTDGDSGNDYLTDGGVEQAWLDAIRGAVAAVP